MKYRISVIIPAYNAEKYIESTILSVINQKTVCEIVIINDGSTDGTDAICKRYSEHYNNIIYFSIENQGAGHARNIGIQNASGEYIVFLDSDDLFIPNSFDGEFENRLELWSKQEIDIIYTTIFKTDMELLNRPVHGYPEEMERVKFFMPFFQFWACIYRRQFLLEKNVTFYEYRKQDIETAFRYKAFSRADKKLSDREIAFYLQRDNLESNTHTFNYYNLYSIKTQVYDELQREQKLLLGKEKEDDNFYFLRREITKNCFKYFHYVFLNGWESEETEKQIELMYDIYKKQKCIPIYKFKETAMNDLCKYYIWNMGTFFYTMFPELYKNISKKVKKKKNVVIKEKRSYNLSTQETLERLTKWCEEGKKSLKIKEGEV